MTKLKMDFQTFGLVNGPAVLFNLLANAFYIFCMGCPLHGERIKQPLKLLLGTLTCCTIIYLISGFVMYFSRLQAERTQIFHITYEVALFSMSTSMTSSVWLNFFYYTQIVPAQRALFIWIKKNTKSIICYIWLVERMVSVICSVVRVFHTLSSDGFEFSSNVTVNDMPAIAFSESLANLFVIVNSTMKAHFIFCLCVMVMSSGSTVVYLSRHMRRMVANGQPLSGPRLSGQVRVTVTGILQGVLYVSCSVWNLYVFISYPTFTMSSTHVSHYDQPGSWSGCVQAESSRHVAQSSSLLQSSSSPTV